MTGEEKPRVVFADRFEDFIMIGFSNGMGGRYSTELLYGLLPQAEQILDESLPLDLNDPEPPVSGIKEK